MQKEGNEFWSTKHLIPEQEYRSIDTWFYNNLFFEDQYKLNLSKFDDQIILFSKKLKGERLIDFLLYSEDGRLELEPEILDDIIRDSLLSQNWPLDAYWFTAHQSHTYKHDVGVIGTYNFRREINTDRNGGLYPVFSNILNEKIGQNIKHNYGLFSGLIGKDKNWVVNRLRNVCYLCEMKRENPVIPKAVNLAEVGDCCLNPDCVLFKSVEGSRIIKFGKTKQCRQKYKCKECLQVFSSRKGTIFYGKRTDEQIIVKSLEALGLGSRIESVAKTHHLKPGTVGQWLKEAGQHARDLEASVFAGYEVSRSEVDGLWSYVKNKGEKK